MSFCLPLYTAACRRKDRTKQIQLPLFPCYVFLRGGMHRRVDVISTPGIHSFVASGGRPAAIPPAEIDAIRLVVETKAASVAAAPLPALRRLGQDHIRAAGWSGRNPGSAEKRLPAGLVRRDVGQVRGRRSRLICNRTRGQSSARSCCQSLSQRSQRTHLHPPNRVGSKTHDIAHHDPIFSMPFSLR